MCMNEVYNFLYNFQTLISGILAILAAVLAGKYLLKSTTIPLQAQKEKDNTHLKNRQRLLALEIIESLKVISIRAEYAVGTVVANKSANKGSEESKERCKLTLEIQAPMSDILSTFPSNILAPFSKLKSLLINHNYDIDRTNPTFGSDDFAQSITARLNQIELNSKSLIDLVSEFERSFDKSY